MMRTVNAVAAARKTARYVCSPRFLNASSGPYAKEERPSAPRPTQARKAISEMCRNRCGSCRSFGPPRRKRFRRCPGLGRCSGSGGTDCAGVLIAKAPNKACTTFPVEQHLALAGRSQRPVLHDAIGRPVLPCISQAWAATPPSVGFPARPLHEEAV